MAGLSPAEISHVERKMRTPRIDTLQKISVALDVTAGFLLGEEDLDIPLAQALSRQSLKIFLRDNPLRQEDHEYLNRICARDSAPDSVKGWKDLMLNVAQLPGQEGSLGVKPN
jgi:transcriptional regulator with XRE-family HTH domain